MGQLENQAHADCDRAGQPAMAGVRGHGFRVCQGQVLERLCRTVLGRGRRSAPVYLSYGPGSGKVNSWDFTHAVRYWTDGEHANQGFIISSAPAYLDALRVFTYRCKELQNRPCVAVIYEPK